MGNRNNNRVKLLIFGIIAVLMTVGFVSQTDLIMVFGNICNNTIIGKSMPAYAYMNDIENPDAADAGSFVVESIYPGKKYYVTAAGGSVINVTEYEKEEEMSELQGEAVKKENGQSGQNDDVSTILSQTKDTARQSLPDVISRDIVSGKVYSKEQLSDYGFSKSFYTVTGITTLASHIFNPSVLIEKDLSMKQSADKPQILIFHTHSQEDFVDSVQEDAATSIVGVGSYLKQVLEEKYGYNVIHDVSVYDYIDGKLDRSKAYTYAVEGVNKILQENPSIEMVIDLHRDGVAEGTRLVTEIDGKEVAKIMLLNGISYSNVNGEIEYLNNPFREENLAVSLQLKLLGEAYYPGFFRNNYINAYRYGLHLRGKSILVEAGAQTNRFEEVKNAMEPLSDVIDKMLKGQKAY